MSADPIEHHSPVPIPFPDDADSFDPFARYWYEVIHGALIVTPRAGTAPITLDDVPELPPGYREEIFEGRLIVTPSAGGLHQYLAGMIFRQLQDRLPEGWVPVEDVNVTKTLRNKKKGYFRPDVAVLRPGQRLAATWFTYRQFGLLVEIASRSTRWLDVDGKLRTYAEQGVDAYWQVEPGSAGEPPTVHVHHTPRNGAYTELETISPGHAFQMTVPFPFLIDTKAMVGRAR